MKYADLYKYRSVWMGFAISWIFFYHMGFEITVPIISQFKEIGYAGCDIFLFASGLGIYYSLDKNEDVLQHMKRRIIRLMPMVWLTFLIWIPYKFHIGEMTWPATIGNVFGIQFFVDNTYDFNWYIPITIFCYMVAPFFKRLLDSFNSGVAKFITLLIIIGVSYVYFNSPYMMLGVSRIGAFYMGMWFGQMGKRDKTISVGTRVFWILMISVGVIAIFFSATHLGFLGWKMATNWVPFFISIPGICIAISLISGVLDKNKVGKVLVKIGDFLGRHSLEIYLSHAMFVMIFRDYMVKNNPNLNTAANWWIVVGLSVALAIILYWLDRLVRIPFKKKS